MIDLTITIHKKFMGLMCSKYRFHQGALNGAQDDRDFYSLK